MLSNGPKIKGSNDNRTATQLFEFANFLFELQKKFLFSLQSLGTKLAI